jgi:hypothetical protein
MNRIWRFDSDASKLCENQSAVLVKVNHFDLRWLKEGFILPKEVDVPCPEWLDKNFTYREGAGHKSIATLFAIGNKTLRHLGCR